MTENNEQRFEPQSDEALARLLEEQMRVMRGQAPTTPAAAAPPQQELFQAAPTPPVPTQASEEAVLEEDDPIDALFGALLDDETAPVQVQEEIEAPAVAPIAYESLDHTQPISLVSEEIVLEEIVEQPVQESTLDTLFPPVAVIATEEVVTESALIQEQGDIDFVIDEVMVEEIIIEQTVIPEVEEDVHSVAERVLNDIGEDGAVYAPIPAAVVSEHVPVPSMFGDTGEIHAAPREESVESDIPPVSYEPVLPDVRDDEPQQATFALKMKPVSSHASRPSFDELVFGEG